MTETKAARMAEIERAIVNLTESPLYQYRTENNYKPVIGDGNLDANIMFIGEAPGENEAKSGKPFVGAAGRVLSELLVHRVKDWRTYRARLLSRCVLRCRTARCRLRGAERSSSQPRADFIWR